MRECWILTPLKTHVQIVQKHQKNIVNFPHNLSIFIVQLFVILVISDSFHLYARKMKECWIFNPYENTWTIYSEATFTHKDYNGAVYENKIYFTDPQNPEIFDPVNKNWSKWPLPLKPSGSYQCSLTWKDTFLLIGGNSNKRGVQSFNHSTQIWTELDASSASMDVYVSGCEVLPNQNILVLGSNTAQFINSSALYNVEENKWTSLGDSNYNRDGTSLVKLGNRVFAIGGSGTDVVEEFIPADNSWIPVDAKPIVPRAYHSTISVPAHLFAHMEGGCVGIH